MRLLGKKPMPLYILLIVITGLILLTGLLFFVLIRWYTGNVARETERLLSVAADEYVDSIDGKLNDYIVAEELVALDQSVRDNIFRKDVTLIEMMDLGKQLKKTIDSLTYFFYQSGGVYSYHLYTYLPGDGSYFKSIDLIRDEWWYRELTESPGSIVDWYAYSAIAGTYQYSMARTISSFGSSVPQTGVENCYQTITINLNALFTPSPHVFRGQTTELYVFADGGELVYSRGGHPDEAGGLYRSTPEGGYSGQNIRLESEELTVLSRSIDGMDADVLLLFSPSALDAQGYFSETIAAAVIGALFVLLLSILLWFYLNFRRRLEQVVCNIDDFDENAAGRAQGLESGDEIARIDRHVLRMQDRIRGLIQKEYTAKMQVLAARMEAMSVCINPHFLYNTLNSISSMACMEGADHTVEMIDALGGMFRYSCDMSRKFVPLTDELRNISDYLYIQKQRFQDALLCSVDVPDELCRLRVPKLALQPLVENAFKHGFTGARNGPRELSLTAAREGEALILTVWDNGCGISPEALVRLRRELETPGDAPNDAGRIGLLNVHRRVRLLCGPEYGLAVKSEEGRYTRVELRLPVNAGEGTDAALFWKEWGGQDERIGDTPPAGHR